jgi:hypothetical protein
VRIKMLSRCRRIFILVRRRELFSVTPIEPHFRLYGFYFIRIFLARIGLV